MTAKKGHVRILCDLELMASQGRAYRSHIITHKAVFLTIYKVIKSVNACIERDNVCLLVIFSVIVTVIDSSRSDGRQTGPRFNFPRLHRYQCQRSTFQNR